MSLQRAFFLSTAQASIKDLTQAKATWQFLNQMDFPAGSAVGLLELSFTNWFVNISNSLNNNKIYYSNDAANLTKYVITIPDGSYSLAAINEYCAAVQQAQAGVAQVIFNLVANYSTNKVGIQFANVTGWYVHFDVDSPYTLMGFTNGQNIPTSKASTANYVEYGPNVASLNNVKSIQVKCDLTTDSISNGRSSSVIYQTTPTSDTGSTQTDRPPRVIWCNLTNTRFSQLTIQLLDQDHHPLVVTEDFSCAIVIKYC